ncbi:hypothetical protein [Nocardioides sp.]|uniref:hypothetical protein n=1 Tax=Nocardioides sp. TaxID=35761 RepID=UPI001A192446|nr:hypothetical protein [Nocardioides sp.]MBJ7359169.1 hypothetical protein [Nocardioides sp.]
MTTAGTAATHLPSTKEIRDLFSGLLGRDVTLTPVGPLAPSATSPRSIGVYADDRLVVRAVVACDLAFSARVGAALALLPAPVAEENIETNTLGQPLAENLYEVFSVGASLFNVPGSAHLKLAEMHPAGAANPPHLSALMLTLGRREDLEISVPGYGLGRISFVICG